MNYICNKALLNQATTFFRMNENLHTAFFRHSLGLILLSLLSFYSCKEGEELPNLPPETSIVVESINLSGGDRLNSIVQLSWNGEDQDGYVIGYELSFNSLEWSFVEIQDSTFRFSLPLGTDTIDLDFFVRAIDNEQAVDPSPAYLQIPIQNTPPVIQLDVDRPIPDTVYSVFSTIWQADDFDGTSTLDRIQVKFNEGPWYDFEPNVNLASFVPTAPTQNGAQVFSVLTGQNRTVAFEVDGLRVGDSNQMFLQAFDITGASSKIDTSNNFFIKAQGGDLLLIDAFGCRRENSDPEDTYFPILDQLYPSYDYFNLCENIPPFWDPTFGLFMNLYDKVFWYADGEIPIGESQLLMESASAQIQRFLNGGGKFLATLSFPDSYSTIETASQSLIYGFSPIDSFSTSVGQARIPINAVASPEGDFATELAPLVSSSFKVATDPFYTENANDVLFTTELQQVQGWVGPDVVGAVTRFSNEEINQAFFSVQLHTFNNDPDALEQLFDYLLNNAFNW